MPSWSTSGLAALAASLLFAAGCASTAGSGAGPSTAPTAPTAAAVAESASPVSTSMPPTGAEDGSTSSTTATTSPFGPVGTRDPAATVARIVDGRAPDWVETFEQLSPERWQVEFSTYGHPDGSHCYRPEQATLVAGALHLTAEARSVGCPDGAERPYASAMVRTEGLVDWTFGVFEFDAELPVADALWPAIWLSPTTSSFGPWPASGEIDVVETVGSEPGTMTCSAHFLDGAGGHGRSIGTTVAEPGARHTFGLIWLPDELIWTVDGTVCHQAPTVALGNPAVFAEPFHLKLNLAVGGGWAGSPSSDTSGTMVVHEVRVWELPAEFVPGR